VKVPGEESIVLTWPDGALVRIADAELSLVTSVPIHTLEDGIGLGGAVPPFASSHHCRAALYAWLRAALALVHD